MTPCPAAARRCSQCLSTGSTEQRGRCIRLCVQARLGTSIPAGCPWMPPPSFKPHPSGSQAQFFNDRQFTEFKSSVGRRCRRQNFSLRRWEADPPTWGRAVGAGNTPPSPRPPARPQRPRPSPAPPRPSPSGPGCPPGSRAGGAWTRRWSGTPSRSPLPLGPSPRPRPASGGPPPPGSLCTSPRPRSATPAARRGCGSAPRGAVGARCRRSRSSWGGSWWESWRSTSGLRWAPQSNRCQRSPCMWPNWT